MAIEDEQKFYDMRMQSHEQDMANAEEKRKRDETQMVQNMHPGNPFADGGRTFALLRRDTSSSAEILHSVIESQRMMYQYDGSDLITPAYPSSSTLPMMYPPSIPDWMYIPPLALEDAPTKRAIVAPQPGPSMAANRQQLVRSKIKGKPSGVAKTAATDRRQYKMIGQVPGRTPEEKLDYLLKQKGFQKKGQTATQ